MSRSRMELVMALVGRKLSPFTQSEYLAITSEALSGGVEGGKVI